LVGARPIVVIGALASGIVLKKAPRGTLGGPLHIAFTIRGTQLHVTMPNLKFTTETISLRMPVPLLHAIKGEANRRNVPYQSLIKLVLAEHFSTAKV
jgi:hypothetical protein